MLLGVSSAVPILMSTAAATVLFENEAISLHQHCMPAGGGLTLESNLRVHILVVSGALQCDGVLSQAGAVMASPAGQTTVLADTGDTPAVFLTLQWLGPTNAPKTDSAPTEVRPWGCFTVISDAPDFKVKTLTVNPESRLSLQRHQKREEHWFVLGGQATVTVNETTGSHPPGTYIHIPLHAWHRLANETTQPVVILEVQLGTYFGEDDIERRADDYGRR